MIVNGINAGNMQTQSFAGMLMRGALYRLISLRMLRGISMYLNLNSFVPCFWGVLHIDTDMRITQTSRVRFSEQMIFCQN